MSLPVKTEDNVELNRSIQIMMLGKTKTWSDQQNTFIKVSVMAFILSDETYFQDCVGIYEPWLISMTLTHLIVLCVSEISACFYWCRQFCDTT